MDWTIGSLFSGIGGIELGLEGLGLGPVLWWAESDPFCRTILARHWPEVLCYDDVRAVDETASAPTILCGGFPCQDISHAGRRAGIRGEQSGLWSEFARVIRVLRPRYVFVENVAALVVRGLDVVLGDLAALRYDAEWDVLGACCVGAPHRRERLFLLACDADRQRQPALPEHARKVGGVPRVAPDAAFGPALGREPGQAPPDADARGDGAEEGMAGRRDDGAVPDTDPKRRLRGATSPGREAWLESQGHGPWAFEPDICRVAHGVPDRVDRVSALGNAVVPQQAAQAWLLLNERLRP